mgnify:CR=1 FL=1
MNTSPLPINLTRYAWLSILAAVLTIGLKLAAYWLTNSVGLLSDALESLVNLAAAIVALIALSIAVRPADKDFTYGYSKVEFFASGFEGGMILLAAISIIASAIPRLLNPQPIEQVGLGLLISVIASGINLAVSLVLKRAGERYGSITLEADSRHLMTDVLTTVGVLIGVGLVALTGWLRLDPLIALIVAVNIIITGISLLRRSARGLMDVALPPSDLQTIQAILKPYEAQGMSFHELRTRTAAARGYVSIHILVPGEWSIQRGHDTAEQIEREIRAKMPQISVLTHVEPLEDEASWQDSLST